MPSLLLVVEGHGEVEATPILVRRVLHERYGIYNWDCEVHRRGGIGHLSGNGWANFDRYLLAAYKERLPILWLTDNDDGECASKLVHAFYERARIVGIQQPMGFCFWRREYESMFLYDPPAVARRFGLQSFAPRKNPDDLRGVKEYVTKHLSRGQCYKETLDQSAITAVMDLQKVLDGYKCFQHFEKVLLWLVQQSNPGLYPPPG